mmetsp:Transcript_4110/g.6015  ORF Transcript_4110/g.6015 Transcript_4110/m.6015 type:complete len:266 (+) Transcript_4110:390-1187(+)
MTSPEDTTTNTAVPNDDTRTEASPEAPTIANGSPADGETTTTTNNEQSPASPQQETAHENGDKAMTSTNGTTTNVEGQQQSQQKSESSSATPAVPEFTVTAPSVPSSSSKKAKFVYDPDKITLRFLFANRDGLSVSVDCTQADTVGEVKGALLSVWPEELPKCSGGSQLRLICMGKGILTPDTKTLEDFQVPSFKTHATPINVSVKPEKPESTNEKTRSFVSSAISSATGVGGGGGSGSPSNTSVGGASSGTSGAASQGCACIIL